MTKAFLDHITDTLAEIDAEGMMKRERLITTPQRGEIAVGTREVINLCANNYLGLADHPDLIATAKEAMDEKGFGMASLPPVLTPTAGCSSRFWGRRMR